MKLERINSIQHTAWLHDPVTIELLREVDAERVRYQCVAENLSLAGNDPTQIKDFVLRAAMLGMVRRVITEPEINNEEGAKE